VSHKRYVVSAIYYDICQNVHQTINRRRIVREVYDKKVVHRLVGVQPKTTVMQGDGPQLNGIGYSKGDGASIVQTVWEPAERNQESEDDGVARKGRSSRRELPREVIDVDAYEEESRYEITGRKRRRTKEEVETIFTTDESNGEDERGEVAPIKINRKRAFWASKAGLGT
jgi:non-canonical poly(A) RNA polymerase PAPD5/7